MPAEPFLPHKSALGHTKHKENKCITFSQAHHLVTSASPPQAHYTVFGAPPHTKHKGNKHITLSQSFWSSFMAAGDSKSGRMDSACVYAHMHIRTWTCRCVCVL